MATNAYSIAIHAGITLLSFILLNEVVNYLQTAEKGLTPMLLAYVGAALLLAMAYGLYVIYLNARSIITTHR